MVPESVHTPLVKGHWNFRGGGGGVGGGHKAKLLEEKYELNWNFLGCEGVQNKKPFMGGASIFSGTTHLKESHFSSKKKLRNDLCL